MVFRIILPALLGAGLSSLLCRGSYKGDYPSLSVSIIGILLLLIFGLTLTIMLVRYGLTKKLSPDLTSFVSAVLLTTLVWIVILC
jgi:hypothetical protein